MSACKAATCVTSGEPGRVVHRDREAPHVAGLLPESREHTESLAPTGLAIVPSATSSCACHRPAPPPAGR
jgi:hypothetical protein